MKERDPDLLLFHATLLRQGMTTPKAMRDVIIALLPATGASLWFFGLSAVLVIGSSIAGAVLAEWMFADRAARGESLHDATGLLTGLLLGLTLPPSIPLWMAFVGGAFGKLRNLHHRDQVDRLRRGGRLVQHLSAEGLDDGDKNKRHDPRTEFLPRA